MSRPPDRPRRLPPGKVPWELIAPHLRRAFSEEVLLGPACGEDAALVRIGGELWAVASDPVTFAATDAGRLAVTVNANDVAVRGARPAFFTAVVLVAPDEAGKDRVAELLEQVSAACVELGVALIGGHTEVTPGIAHSVVAGTMLGRVANRPITTGGLQPDDRVGVTRWAGLEGTSILLAELGDRLRAVHGAGVFADAEEVIDERSLSVVPEALAAAAVDGVTALHDVTEGGIGEALHELGTAAGLQIRVDLGAIPVLEATRVICADLGMDPLGLIGSGSLLVGCAEHAAASVAAALAGAGSPVAWIGRAGEGSPGSTAPRFPRDELLKASVARGIRAVVFDMDGTLVHSDYDWPAIRRRLGVDHPSIIDGLNGLPQPHRDDRWRELETIEARATREATLAPGARGLLRLLADRNLRTALVTNNSDANTRDLLRRFGLSFDVVLTRDSGLYKPSPAPLVEAAGRLGVPPEGCLAVGDSGYDLDAARNASYRAVCLIREHSDELARSADLWFPDLTGLKRHFELVLP